MLALSIRAEQVALILSGEKRIEYRSWRTDHRGALLIVSCKRPKHPPIPCGHAICIVAITECRFNARHKDYEWIFGKVTPLAEPLPVRGRLGLYQVENHSLVTAMNNPSTAPRPPAQSSLFGAR